MGMGLFLTVGKHPVMGLTGSLNQLILPTPLPTMMQVNIFKRFLPTQMEKVLQNQQQLQLLLSQVILSSEVHGVLIP